jgi:polyhydroxybutyrate depolymerase
MQSLQVFVFQGIGDATLMWDQPEGYADSAVDYTVFLDDSLIASHVKTRNFKFTNLHENTEYNGKIEAYTGSLKIAEQAFSFKTLVNQPPKAFSIYETAIGCSSVAIKWNKSTDPENGVVVYDIYINNKLEIIGVKDPNCKVEGLIPNTSYRCGIVARDTSGKSVTSTVIFGTINYSKSVLVHRYFEYKGYQRDFAYYLPTNYDSASQIPLVINLHGANGNAWNEINHTYFKEVADRENFILLMPQALLGTFNGETIYQWNAHYIFPWDDVSLLGFLIDYMYTQYHIDLSKVYISGMSNGGFMTFFAARGLQDRIAAIAPISGLISSNVFINYSLNRPIPLCYMHGTADNIVKINSVPSADSILSFWAVNNNCIGPPQVSQLPDVSSTDNSTVSLYQYNGYLPVSEIQYYKINGGGHSIPGVEPGANMDINAYEVIWAFFKRHTYPEHAAGTIVSLD